jgi:predicted phosphodiesterase
MTAAPRQAPQTTLVLSDLHLGLRSGHDLMRHRQARAVLRERLDGIDRVVLLGDTLELRQGRLSAALGAAQPFFEELGAALGDREVVLVPGNHDHRLLATWHEQRRVRDGAALGLEHRIKPSAGEAAGVLAEWLWPAELTLAYPGLRIRPDVYATHGHYLDRHTTLPTLERLALGAMGRLVGPVPERPVPDDYEAGLAPLYAWIHELAQGVRGHRGSARPAASRLQSLAAPGVGDRPPRIAALGAGLPLAIAVLNRAGLGPLRSDMALADLWRAGVRAMEEVCARLALDAAFVLFGHLHRAGPWWDDDPAAWTARTGTRFVNTGSWVGDPGLRAADGGDRYRPGTCVVVGADGPPVVEDLLGSSGVGAGRAMASASGGR